MQDAGGLQPGTILKPYGLNGALNVAMDPEFARKIKINDPLFIEIDGQRVPFFVEDIPGGGDNFLIVKLEFINSLEEARRYTGLKVYRDLKTGSDEAENDLSRLVGYIAEDVTGNFRGEVVDYIDHNMNRVLIINFKGREVMVPVAEGILLSTNHKSRIISVKLPDGIINLNE